MPFIVKAVVDRDSLDGTLRLLKWLPEKLQQKVLRKAVGVASRKLAKAVRSGIPIRTGILKKSIGSKVKIYKKTGAVVGVIGARKGFRQQIGTYKQDSGKSARYPHKKGDPVFANPVNYLHLVELGTFRTRAFKVLENTTNAMKPTIRAEMIKAINKGLKAFSEGKL